MFECNKCGMCCRNLQNSVLYDELNRGDGICRYLNGNLCSIYEERPLICRVDDFYNVYLKDEISLLDYYKLNYDACNMLKNEGV